MRFFVICIVVLFLAAAAPFAWDGWLKPELQKLARRPGAEADAQQPPDPGAAKPAQDGPAGDNPRPREEDSKGAAAPPDDVRPPARNRLIKTLQDAIESSPAFEEEGAGLQDQLAEADALLSRIKEENQQALARANRPPMLRGRSVRRPHLVVLDLGRLRPEDLLRDVGNAQETAFFRRLGRQGVVFDAFYRTSLDDRVSQAALLTGRFERTAPLRALQADLLSQVLVKNGYRTALIGDGSFLSAEGLPLAGATARELGFQRFFGARTAASAGEQFPRKLWTDEAKVDVLPDDSGKRQEAQEIYVRQAIAFCKQQSNRQPFFLWLALPGPNTGSGASGAGASGAGASGAGASGAGASGAAAYRRSLQRTRADVQRVVHVLNERQLALSSVVFLTALRAAPALPRDLQASAGGAAEKPDEPQRPPLRRRENRLDEGNLRAPLLVVGPGRVRRRTVAPHLCSVADLAATLADFAGAGNVTGWEGESFAPLLRGRRQEPRSALQWTNPEGEQAVRAGDWKAVRPGAVGRTQLYNLARDPGEQEDIAGYEPAIVAKMKRQFEEIPIR